MPTSRVTLTLIRIIQAFALALVLKKRFLISSFLTWGFQTLSHFGRSQMPLKRNLCLKISLKLIKQFYNGGQAVSLWCKIGLQTQSWSVSQGLATQTFSTWCIHSWLQIKWVKILKKITKVRSSSTLLCSGCHCFTEQLTALFKRSNLKPKKLCGWWVWTTYLTGCPGGLTLPLSAWSSP